MYSKLIIKLKSVWVLLLFLTANKTHAQTNLVPNGGFEALTSCQLNVQVAYDNSPNWEKPVGSTATPDVFQKECANITCDFNDTKCVGEDQASETRAPGFDPSEGWKFGGIILYSSRELYREYMSVKLAAPLKKGKCYRFSFKIRNARSMVPYNYISPTNRPYNIYRQYYSNNMGAYFSKNKPAQQNGNDLINANPQVNISTLITANAVWEEYVFYLCADGGEEWLTMGNFFSDINTLISGYNSKDCGWGPNAYYCLDEITLYELSDYHKLIENTTYSSGTTKVIQYSQTITAGFSVDPFQTNGNVEVQSGADITYKAMEGINLKPGFSARSKFHAYIDPSTPCGADCDILGKKALNLDVVGNETIENESVIQVYPNPSDGMFEFKGMRNSLIIITNISGKLIEKIKVNEDNDLLKIDLTDYPNGIYLLTAENGDGIFQVKLIKQ